MHLNGTKYHSTYSDVAPTQAMFAITAKQNKRLTRYFTRMILLWWIQRAILLL
jgi:hypothetical protein